MGAKFDSKKCSLRTRNEPVPSYYIIKCRNATNFGTAKMIKQIPFFLSNSSSLFLRSSNSSTFLSRSFFSVSVRISFKISRRSRPRIFWFSSSLNNVRTSSRRLSFSSDNFPLQTEMSRSRSLNSKILK